MLAVVVWMFTFLYLCVRVCAFVQCWLFVCLIVFQQQKSCAFLQLSSFEFYCLFLFFSIMAAIITFAEPEAEPEPAREVCCFIRLF